MPSSSSLVESGQQRRSRRAVCEIHEHGSVRGAPGDGRPYSRSDWHGRRTGGESPPEGPDDGNLLTEGKGLAPRGGSHGSRRCNDELN